MDGADSWHPESPCDPICAFANAGGATVQETCSKSAASAANAATLTANWTIERMPMRSSQNQGATSILPYPCGFHVPAPNSARNSS